MMLSPLTDILTGCGCRPGSVIIQPVLSAVAAIVAVTRMLSLSSLRTVCVQFPARSASDNVAAGAGAGAGAAVAAVSAAGVSEPPHAASNRAHESTAVE